MLSLAISQSLQVYGIAIVVSMIVAVLIKVLVALTGRVKRPAAKTLPAAPVQAKAEVASSAIPGEVVAAISAALSVTMGPHRVLHIAETGRSWANVGRSAQHSHQPRH